MKRALSILFALALVGCECRPLSPRESARQFAHELGLFGAKTRCFGRIAPDGFAACVITDIDGGLHYVRCPAFRTFWDGCPSSCEKAD